MQIATPEPATGPKSPMRVYCVNCHHTEFVHCDFEARTCLYSECRCGGFTLTAAA